MRTIACILAVAFSLESCNGQIKNEDMGKTRIPADTIASSERQFPGGSWTVTKEIDEQGNIIRYDSVYTYSYSNLKGDTIAIKDVDSVIRSFKKYFESRIPSGWKNSFLDAYWNDPLLEEDFFKRNYFFSRWEEDGLNMESKLRKMDSIRDQFFRDFHPGLIRSDKKRDSI